MKNRHGETSRIDEGIIDCCVDLAEYLINRKQAGEDAEFYMDEFDGAACVLYSTVLYCIEHNIKSFNVDMAKGLFLGIIAGYVSGQMPTEDEYNRLALKMTELVQNGNCKAHGYQRKKLNSI